MIYAVVAGTIALALVGAGWAFYRLGRSRANRDNAERVLEEQENKDARRNDSLRAADEFADIVQWEDDNGEGGPDAS